MFCYERSSNQPISVKLWNVKSVNRCRNILCYSTFRLIRWVQVMLFSIFKSFEMDCTYMVVLDMRV